MREEVIDNFDPKIVCFSMRGIVCPALIVTGCYARHRPADVSGTELVSVVGEDQGRDSAGHGHVRPVRLRLDSRQRPICRSAEANSVRCGLDVAGQHEWGQWPGQVLQK